MLMPISAMCTDLYAPSLPYIAAYYHVPKASIGFTMSAYLLGLGLGQIPYGMASDVYGRRKPLLFGISIYIAACLVILIWHKVSALMMGRFFQGIGTAAISAITKSIIKDSFTGLALKRNLSLLATSWGLGLILGPVIGSYLLSFYGWLSCFVFLLGFGILAWYIVIYHLPETHEHRHALDFKRFTQYFLRLLSCRAFMCSVLNMGFNYGLLLIFNVMGPFIIQGTLNYSPVTFGHLALVVGAVFVSSTYLNRYLFARFEIATILRIVAVYLFFASIAMMLVAFLLPLQLVTLMLSSLMVMAVVGILYPASMVYAMSLFPEIAGTAAAVVGTINLGITALVSGVASVLPVGTMHTYSVFYFVLAALILVCVNLAFRERRLLQSS